MARITKLHMAIHLLLQGDKQADVVRVLRCGVATVERAAKAIKEGSAKEQMSALPFTDRVDGITRTIIVNGLGEAIKSADDMLNFFKVDKKEWRIKKQRINAWGGPQNPNGQRRLELERIPGSGIYEEYLEAAMAVSPGKEAFPELVGYEQRDTGRLAFLSIHDLHFGLQAWGKETGIDYDIKIAKKLFLSCVEHYAEWCENMKVERIVLLVGSDFFNVNGKLNSTVKGTPLDEDDRWKKTFVLGRKMAVNAIDTLRAIAPVEAIVVGGNHDEERVFMLGESLFAWYRNCDNVTIDNFPGMFKFKHWGRNLLGICHGDGPKIQDLPLIMANDAPSYMWASTEYREWHTGHLHHDRRVIFESVVDKQGIKVRIAPSLVAASTWEHSKGYRSAREATMVIYDRDQGAIAEIPFRPCMVEKTDGRES